jgi:hypothetical protein
VLVGNIRSRTDVAERLWDWAFLNPCFAPTKIKASDVDGEVERNGFFLRIEGKPPSFRLETATATKITYNSLLRLKRRIGDGTEINAFTVLVIYGDPTTGAIQEMQVYPNQRRRCSVVDVQAFVRDWFRWASALSE